MPFVTSSGLVASLLLVAMPFATLVASLLLVAMPFVTRTVLAPSRGEQCSFFCLAGEAEGAEVMAEGAEGAEGEAGVEAPVEAPAGGDFTMFT